MAEIEVPVFWRGGEEPKPDEYVAFRATFHLETEGEVEIRTLGSGWSIAWLDGEYLTEGPARYQIQHPQYEMVASGICLYVAQLSTQHSQLLPKGQIF